MFSKACEYAIKALIYIASQSEDAARIGLTDIASKTDSPLHFTGKIMQVLSKKGLVSSVKGPNGGFYIEKNASPIFLVDVVTAIDGLESFCDCGLGLKECSDKNPCPIHHEYNEVRSSLMKMLKTKTIQSLANDLKAGNVILKNL